MKILLTGASGFIGSHLLRALQGRGHEVRGCLRHPVPGRLPGVETIACDFAQDLDEARWLARLDGVEVVINAVGIIRERRNQRYSRLHRDAPAALFRAAARCGVRRVIQISALGADEQATSPYHLSKRAADELLMGLDLEWTILRPSIVTGRGAGSTALFRALAALPITPLPEGGEQLLQPIHVADLTRVVVQALELDGLVGQTLDLVGPRAITLRELLVQQRVWLDGGRLRPLALPAGVMSGLARLGGGLGIDAITPESVAMLQRGNHADVAPLQRLCGFTPQALEGQLWQEPVSEADRWHARLYFLAPLLRLSLALLWIFTGIVSLWLYPHVQSYALLYRSGVSEGLAPLALYGAGLLDLALGVALWLRYRVVLVAQIQLAMIVGYSLIIALALPEFLLHPYGPLSKNLPLIIATLMMLQLERR